MQLMTKAIEKRFKEVGSQENEKDPIVIAKFFKASGAGTWWSTEYNPIDKIFFGYVSIFGDHNDEWGYFSLEELQSFKGAMGLGIERDLYFQEQRIGKLNIKSLK